MKNKVAGAILLLAAAPLALFGYLEGGGMHGFVEFRIRIDDEPHAILMLIGAAVCVVGGISAFVRRKA